MRTLTFFKNLMSTGVLSICLISSVHFAQAQPALLPTFIEKDLVLGKGTYLVEFNTKIGENATLKVKHGTKIIFNKGASIKVEGGLILDGRPNKLIEITSASLHDEGMGLVITGANKNKTIEIQYAYFHNLLIPLNFETNWYRNNVNINNNLFMEIETGEPGIIIRRPDEIKYQDSANFIFSKNNFTGNNSIIYIENAESDVLQMAFEYNLVSGNYFHGFDITGSLNSPVHIQYDQLGLKYTAKFTGNSIFGNYIINNQNDTVIHESNLSIRGNGEKFDVSGNYYGNRDERAIVKTFNHFVRDASLPFLNPSPQLQEPSSLSHGHIWKIFINDKEVTGWQIPEMKQDTITIKVIANRKMWIIKSVDYITYHYYEPKTNMVFNMLLSPYVTDMGTDTTSLGLTFSNEIFSSNLPGYFTISGMLDHQGFPAPEISIGKNQFVRRLSEIKK